MAAHDGIERGHEGIVGHEIAFHEIFLRFGNEGESVVWIYIGKPAGRKMLGAGEHLVAVAQVAIENASIADDFLGVGAVAASPHGIVCAVIVGNIEHWSEVHVDAELAEDIGCDHAVAGDESGDFLVVASFTELLCRWWGVAYVFGAGDSAAFLIDADEWLDIAHFAQGVSQCADLLRAFYISAEDDESSGLDFAESGNFFRSEFESVDAEE